MKRIALVTDSTADLTAEMQKEFNVHTIPLKIRFGEEEFPDGTLPPAEFYRRLVEEENPPQTSQPSPEEFRRLYQKLLADHDAILSIHLSSALSGTVNAASLAKADFRQEIEVFDSKNISLGMGILIKEAARLIREGLSLPQIRQELQRIREKIVTLFTLDQLEYLHKGGRIGKVPNLLGSLLKVKPIIRVNADGVYVLQGIARSQERALKGIVQAFQELVAGRKPSLLFVAHGAAKQAGEHLKSLLETAFQRPASAFAHVGPVIGAHTGPGTVGAALLLP
ncbi:MAG TPA: DegV family protein [Capillibacterium sp.]